MEANVLYALYRQGAPVPRVLALDGKWTIQEDLGGRRLPSILDNADTAQIEVALGAAIESLARIHEAGSKTGLERFVVTIGDKPEWLLELIDTPRRLGKYFALPAPKLAETALVDQLRVVVPRLIKWDARPGNAMVRANGTVAWFDWEHCACRNRLDDLAWLLGDEYVPDLPDVEERLLDVHLSAFTDDGDADKARQYLAAFGTFHMCVRLALIVTKKGTGPWWDWQYCVAGDKVGVSLEAARRTCLRASRWAAKTELTERERDICAAVGPGLVRMGILFAGLDVIGDWLTEINVTSPTGIREIAALDGVAIEEQVLDGAERWIAARRGTASSS